MAQTYEGAIAAARKRGTAAGIAAASWVVDVGRMSSSAFRSTRDEYRDDPDEFVSELVNNNVPRWLSGEFAGESVAELLGDVIRDIGSEYEEDVFNAYEEAATEAFESEVANDCEAAFGEEGEGDDDEDDEDDDDEDDDRD